MVTLENREQRKHGGGGQKMNSGIILGAGVDVAVWINRHKAHWGGGSQMKINLGGRTNNDPTSPTCILFPFVFPLQSLETDAQGYISMKWSLKAHRQLLSGRCGRQHTICLPVAVMRLVSALSHVSYL